MPRNRESLLQLSADGTFLPTDDVPVSTPDWDYIQELFTAAKIAPNRWRVIYDAATGISGLRWSATHLKTCDVVTGSTVIELIDAIKNVESVYRLIIQGSRY